MAVTEITEDWRALDVDTSVSLEGAAGSMKRRFDVVFDTADDTADRPILAMTASHGGVSIPAYWDAHPANGDFFVSQIKVAPNGGPTMWAVEVTYTYIENPLTQPYSVRFVPQRSTEAIDRAITQGVFPETFDKELCNSAKEPFDPPVQEEQFDFSVQIQRNEAAFNIVTAREYLNTVNRDTFGFRARNSVLYTFPAGQACCKNIDAAERRHGPYWYFQVGYEFHIRLDGWLRRFLDQGFREIVNDSYRQIADAEGNPLTQPAKLNGSGLKLSPAATPVFIEYQTKRTALFSSFQFV